MYKPEYEQCYSVEFFDNCMSPYFIWIFLVFIVFKVNKGVEASLIQLLETGLLHADPHPGNLRYTSSGQLGYPPLPALLPFDNTLFVGTNFIIKFFTAISMN